MQARTVETNEAALALGDACARILAVATTHDQLCRQGQSEAVDLAELRWRPTVHPLSFLAATFAVGIAVLSPFYLAEIASGRLIENRAERWLAISYVCLFPSLIAYLLF